MLQIPSLRQHWDAIQEIVGQKITEITTFPLKKPGFSFVFAKNSPAKNFWLPKISASVDYDPANAFKQ